MDIVPEGVPDTIDIVTATKRGEMRAPSLFGIASQPGGCDSEEEVLEVVLELGSVKTSNVLDQNRPRSQMSGRSDHLRKHVALILMRLALSCDRERLTRHPRAKKVNATG